MPPIFRGELLTKILPTTSGQIILFGVCVCMAGIAVAGMAGMSKEREMSEEAKKEAIKEFDFKKGIMVATFSGVMSACFSYGLGRRRSHQGNRSPARYHDALARTARSGRAAPGRVHHELHLVHDSSYEEQNRLSVP